MRFSTGLTKLIGIMGLALLAGCGGTFRTYYPETAPAAQSATWRLSAVNVTVPRSLAVSEAETFVPRADIVWREDQGSNRYQQVEKIMKDAISKGAQGLTGDRPVTIEATVTRFHAMTFLAERKAPGGVHDVEFDLQVRDATTGAVLFGPEHVEASFPAMAGDKMVRARLAGETQKSQITAHVAATIRGILGLGPDARETFSGLGA